LFSIDHGLGKILEYNRKKDNNTGSRVVLYRMKKGLKARIFLSRSETPEIANEITDDYFKLMAGKNILVPVVKLRPLVNMKFN
jgi:RNA-splicing ligase RtcB